MRIFTMNVFRRISIQAHLVRVDLLDTRILQADALLMHSMAKKKALFFYKKNYIHNEPAKLYEEEKHKVQRTVCYSFTALQV